ncbi:MAG: histidine kinase dimerization/phospho-acceptor domain-containing protein [Ferruginibacter sp.]
MGKQSKIAELGMLNILYQMKNPLTNIRLAVEMMDRERDELVDRDCREIIKNSAVALEESIRDLCRSFNELGVSIHIEQDITPM